MTLWASGGQFGYYTDGETGLLCLTHRYYDPGTGRFVNRDPSGYKGGVNLYGFAGNNPVNRMDPSGLAKVEVRFKDPGGTTTGKNNHAFMVITDTDPERTQWYIRGGPSSSALLGLGSPIEVVSGYYDITSPDWASKKLKSITIVNDKKPASYYLNLFAPEEDSINSAQIPYSAWRNSNTVISDLLDSSGLPTPEPPVTAIGWDNDLFRDWYDPLAKQNLKRTLDMIKNTPLPPLPDFRRVFGQIPF